MAHDLRAPLRAIDGYCQILLEDHAAQLDEEGQGLLGNVGRRQGDGPADRRPAGLAKSAAG